MSTVVEQARFRWDHSWAPGQMSGYVDGELGPRALARMERHTKDCPDCRRALNGLQRVVEALHGLPPIRTSRETELVVAVRTRLRERPRT
jgi:anti-sigma factor RsiW